MPKIYRKPQTRMNRKKYGKVKPVKQEKTKNPYEKPSTMVLRSIYSRMKKSASWQIPEAIAAAIQWYRSLWVYLMHEPKVYAKMVSVPMTREKVMRDRKIRFAHSHGFVKFSDKIEAMWPIIRSYEGDAAKLGIKVPHIQPALKKAKTSAKKIDERSAKVEKKYDPLLTILAAASNIGVDLGAVPAIAGEQFGERPFKYDSTLNKLMYSRAALAAMKKRIRAEGMLPVMLDQMFYISRAKSMKNHFEQHGVYEVNHVEWLGALTRALDNMCKWFATSQDSPPRLIKRTVPKKKRAKKTMPLAIVEGTDVHAVVAEKLGLNREPAKAINVGIHYGNSLDADNVVQEVEVEAFVKDQRARDIQH